jgi:hypothetical protein
MTNTKNELRQEAATEISYILSALGLQDWADGSQALFQALQGTRKADISAVIETLRTIKTAVRVDREALKVYDCAEAARALAKVDRDTAAGCQCGEAYGRRAPLVALCGYCRHGRQTRRGFASVTSAQKPGETRTNTTNTTTTETKGL